MNILACEDFAHADTARASGAPELAVIVPTYCEVENVPRLLAALAHALNGVRYEVIFVDDDSTDGTVQAIRAIAQSDGRVRAIRRVGRRGLSGAVIEGMLSTSAEFIAVMDCDLQHDEALLKDMLGAVRGGADMAIATRYMDGGSAAQGFAAGRERASRLATWLAEPLLKQPVSDPMSGFFMLRRTLAEEVAPRLSTAGFKVLLDIIASHPKALDIVEIPYVFRERAAGASKLDGRIVADFVGLVVAKLLGDAISTRFVMFAIVGLSGLIVHISVLKAALWSGLATFAPAQLFASTVAMTWNFLLNNQLTYADRRLKGWAALRGFISFALVCSIGILANVGVSELIYTHDPDWLIAGVAGALMAAVFNYAVTAAVTWRDT